MAFTSGFVLMFFSELYFINEGPAFELLKAGAENPISLIPWLITMTLWYSGCTYILLSAIGFFRVRSLWSLFLAGALFGWAVEGILCPMVYVEFPYAISWTSLGWHAFIDVMIGWYLVRKILLKNKYLYTTIMSVVLGLFWGIWATWFWIEAEAGGEFGPIPVLSFAPYSFGLLILLILAYIILEKFAGHEFKPSIIEIILLLCWMVWCFYWNAWKQYPFSIYVLPSLYAVVLIALWWNRKTESRLDILSSLKGRVAYGHYALLLIIPALASATYAVYYNYNINIPIVMFVAIPLTYAGFAVLALSLVMIALQKKNKA
jgi:hypothetical protein